MRVACKPPKIEEPITAEESRQLLIATDGRLGKNIKIGARLLRRLVLEHAALNSHFHWDDKPIIQTGGNDVV